MVILFAETRGFTRTSDMLEPAVVLARISEFFALVQTAVEQHGGIVRNVLNDNLVASFAGKANAQQAVKAAQTIQREFATYEESWERDYGIRAAVAIGLHAGDAVIGTIGKPVPDQLLIISDSVSIAERLLHRARRRVRVVRIGHGRARRGKISAGYRGTAAPGDCAPRADPAVRRAARYAPGFHLTGPAGITPA